MSGQICVFNDVNSLPGNSFKVLKRLTEPICAINCFIVVFYLFFKSANKVLKNLNLEKCQVLRQFTDACDSCSIQVSDFKETMTAHGVSVTAISIIFECDHAPSAVALQTSHSFLKSIKS